MFWPTLNEVQNKSKSHKIGVHAYFSNGYLNPLSKINPEKVDKSAYFQPWFDQAWMTTNITPNITKIGVHAYLSNGYLIHFQNKIPRKSTKCIFSTLVWPALNEGQNVSKSHKIRCPCLSLKWVPKNTLKFEFWDIEKNATF